MNLYIWGMAISKRQKESVQWSLYMYFTARVVNSPHDYEPVGIKIDYQH